MKKAFTLAEILVTLSIIAIIMALTIPKLLVSPLEDKVNRSLFRFAYNSAESVANELIEDSSVLSNNTFVFNSTFCQKFATMMNTNDVANCSVPIANVTTIPNFTTTNGMKWYGLNGATFTCDVGNGNEACANVTVDINGLRFPNVDHVDRMRIYISPGSKLTIPSGNETTALTKE